MKYSKIVETWFTKLVSEEGALVDSLYQCRIDDTQPFMEGRTPGLSFLVTTPKKRCVPGYLLASNTEPPALYYQDPSYVVIDVSPVLDYTTSTEESHLLWQHPWFHELMSRKYLVGRIGTDAFRI